MSSSTPAPGPFLPPGHDARHHVVRGVPRRDAVAVDLAVADVGDADRPALVVAHGVGSSARFVAAACAAPLLRAGWRLVVYDARGHGASTACPDPADHDLSAYVADLDAVVRATEDVAVVAGVSLGGHAALRSRGPWPRVVCLPAWSGRATPGVGVHALVADEVRRVGVEAVVDRLRADTTMPAWLRETLVTDYARHDPDSLGAALLALDGADAPDHDEVARLGIALAVVAWRDDPGHPFAVAERLVAAVPGATLTELALTDLEASLTRFGEALLAALRSLDLTG